MKTKNFIYSKHIITVLIVLFISTSVQAQITFPDDIDDEAPAAPIDGFIAIGIAAGAYLGLKKQRQSEK